MGGILGQIATGLIGQGMGLISDSRNQRQNEQNAKREYKYGNMMAEENLRRQKDLWEYTGPMGMSRELEKAGMSKALMYGGVGAGGQTAAATGGNVSGGASNVKGEGTAEAMGLAMMQAQKENIEADTEVKRQEKKLKFEETGIKGAEHLMQQYLSENTIEGKDAEGSYVNSAAAKMALENVREKVIGNIFQESENARRKAMNIEELKKVQEEIELLKRKGNTEQQILQNLIKDGTIKDAEIEWNKVGLTKETFGQLIIGLLKGAVK